MEKEVQAAEIQLNLGRNKMKSMREVWRAFVEAGFWLIQKDYCL